MLTYDAANLMNWSKLGMRKAFGPILCDVMEAHPEVIVLAADIASSANLNCVAQRYPDRFYNMGIAEQNMVGVAAGLAKEGNHVFAVSFAPFISMRAYEAIRTLVSYMHLSVTAVALGSGLSLGVQGSTHYGLEDLSLMRTIPGMRILSPADCCEMAKMMDYLAAYDGPAYLRLTGIDGTNRLYKEDFDFRPDTPDLLREGSDVAILATGTLVSEAVRASRALSRENISCAVYNVSTCNPFDPALIPELCGKFRLLVTVEEHQVTGGLGSIVADALSALPAHPPLRRIGIQNAFPHAGEYAYLLDAHGLSAPHIRDFILANDIR